MTRNRFIFSILCLVTVIPSSQAQGILFTDNGSYAVFNSTTQSPPVVLTSGVWPLTYTTTGKMTAGHHHNRGRGNFIVLPGGGYNPGVGDSRNSGGYNSTALKLIEQIQNTVADHELRIRKLEQAGKEPPKPVKSVEGLSEIPTDLATKVDELIRRYPKIKAEMEKAQKEASDAQSKYAETQLPQDKAVWDEKLKTLIESKKKLKEFQVSLPQ